MVRLRRMMLRNKARVVGVVVLSAFIICALLSSWLAPHDPW